MIEHSFSLIPFPDANIPDIHITGTVARKQNLLEVHYVMTGQTNLVFFPEVTAHPQRKDDLWRTTCFESFLAVPGKTEYWEFNMSPSGDWNAYHMDAYRQVGLRQEACIQQLQFSVEIGMAGVVVDAAIDLAPLIEDAQEIQVEITSVIEDQNGHETYWSLIHPGPEPDFHRREGFVLLLNSVS